ncbi:PE family protein, partial [Mycobacterium intermedium]
MSSSLVVANPGFLSTAAAELAGIQRAITAANAAAAGATTQVLTAAGDEVSAAIATLFGNHGYEYQALSEQAALFHAQFAQALDAGARAYTAAEAAAAAQLQTLGQDALAAINAQTQAWLGRPLIGDGADGTAAHPDGRPGGLLYGNGGNGFSPTEAGVAGGRGGAA